MASLAGDAGSEDEADDMASPFCPSRAILNRAAGHFIKANKAGRLRRTARGCGVVSSGRGALHRRWMGGGNGVTGMAGQPV
ncbi:hypothetical protein PAMC26510_31625 [Caballeronia sordidicola]|uniref:Uncharacterized protein n=1 Tax=Caballeronia sordidicola TaxID=196367 RepID=A0A242M897_CABSO|nr:hypothetical protein PAMC26510_31625 [Caballeronia sordidicola]OTP70066.1 hypothetical protein PAMC26577_27535 [Caballeronia sordidicola]